MPSDIERRKSARRQARIKVRFWTDTVDRVGRSADLSSTGLFIETRHPLPPETPVHLELLLPKRSFFAEGVVTRALPGEAVRVGGAQEGMAVKIVPLSEALLAVERTEPSGS